MLLLLVRYQLKQPTESTQEEEQVTRVELRASFRPKYASVRFLAHAKSARVFHTHVANCACSRTPKKTTTRDPTTLSKMETRPTARIKRIQLFNSKYFSCDLCLAKHETNAYTHTL